MNELATALGFDGALAAHATASAFLFVLVYRFAQGAVSVHPKVEKLIAAAVVALLNVLVDVARDRPITHAMISSVIVGAFLALLIYDAATKKKEQP